MLVLSRRRDESIRIGEDIQVTVLRIGATSVKLGITAPAELKVLRLELEPLGADEPHQSDTPDRAVSNLPDVADALHDWLTRLDADGLVHVPTECGCSRGDLRPCCGPILSCVPARRVAVPIHCTGCGEVILPAVEDESHTLVPLDFPERCDRCRDQDRLRSQEAAPDG